VPPVEAPIRHLIPLLSHAGSVKWGTQHRRIMFSRICCGAVETCSAWLTLTARTCLQTKTADSSRNPRMPTFVLVMNPRLNFPARGWLSVRGPVKPEPLPRGTAFCDMSFFKKSHAVHAGISVQKNDVWREISSFVHGDDRVGSHGTRIHAFPKARHQDLAHDCRIIHHENVSIVQSHRRRGRRCLGYIIGASWELKLLSIRKAHDVCASRLQATPQSRRAFG